MEITDEVRSRMGTATITDGTWTLTYVRHLDHPVEKVWRAITESEHLAAWFPCDIVGERRSGADVDHAVLARRRREVRGRRAEHQGSHRGVGSADALRADVGGRPSPLGAGADARRAPRSGWSTVIEDPAIAMDAAAGWHVCLDRLQVRLDSGVAAPLADHPMALQAEYEAAAAASRRRRATR